MNLRTVLVGRRNGKSSAAFVEVAEQRRFGAAADRLSITQPALTKQIQALERELSAPLFRRGRQGATLTEFGRLLSPQARDLVAGAEEFTRRGHQLARGERGRLAVGFGLSTIDLAPRPIAAFRQRHPQVEIGLEDLPSATQVERLRTGERHVGFLRLPAGPGLRPWLGEQRLVRLARAAGPGLVAQVDRLCAAWRVRPGTAHETNHLHTVLALAAAIAPAAVRPTPVPDPAAAWTVGVAWRADPPHAITTNFIAVVRTGSPVDMPSSRRELGTS